MAILIVQGECWEDGGCACMARVVDNDASNAEQADVSAISRSAFDLDGETPATAVDTSAVAVASSIFDTLQTDDRWTEDATGYNFRDTVPASVLANGGHRYRVEYKFTPVAGEVYWAVYSLWVEGVYTS